MKTQARIGWLFLCTALAVFLLQFFFIFANKEYLSVFDFIKRFHFVLYIIVFAISIKYENMTIKLLQASCVACEGIITLCLNKTDPFMGLALLVISILLLFCYGAYNKRVVLRAIMTSLAVYLSLYFIVYINEKNGIVLAFEYTAFMFAFLFVLWFIFKDQIERLQQNECKDKERYMRIIEEATSVAKDAIALCEKEKQKLLDPKG